MDWTLEMYAEDKKGFLGKDLEKKELTTIFKISLSSFGSIGLPFSITSLLILIGF
jgi:hypothetical protein